MSSADLEVSSPKINFPSNHGIGTQARVSSLYCFFWDLTSYMKPTYGETAGGPNCLLAGSTTATTKALCLDPVQSLRSYRDRGPKPICGFCWFQTAQALPVLLARFLLKPWCMGPVPFHVHLFHKGSLEDMRWKRGRWEGGKQVSFPLDRIVQGLTRKHWLPPQHFTHTR